MFPVQSGWPDIIASLHTIFAVYIHRSRVIFYSYCDRLIFSSSTSQAPLHTYASSHDQNTQITEKLCSTIILSGANIARSCQNICLCVMYACKFLSVAYCLTPALTLLC